jgi:hypothetical protein
VPGYEGGSFSGPEKTRKIEFDPPSADLESITSGGVTPHGYRNG